MVKISSTEKHRQMISRHKDEFKKRRELLSKDPFIDSYEKELASLFRKCAAGEFRAEEYEKRSDKIEKKRRDRLIALGEREDAMIYKPLCPICDDSGNINGRVCKCLRQIIIDDLYSASGMAEILKKENFDTFDLNRFSDAPFGEYEMTPRQFAERLRQAMMNYVNNFDKTTSSLFFAGPTGTGKTFMSHCIAKALLDNGKTVIYTTAYNMCDRLVDNQFGRLDDDEVEMYFDCDFLIIDELGQETNNDPSRTQLYNVLNERITRSKKTLITSNYSLKHLENRYKDESIISRLSLYRRYHFFGNDLRVTKNVATDKLDRSSDK